MITVAEKNNSAMRVGALTATVIAFAIPARVFGNFGRFPVTTGLVRSFLYNCIGLYLCQRRPLDADYRRRYYSGFVPAVFRHTGRVWGRTFFIIRFTNA